MKITILTLFPEMFIPLQESIIGRAVKGGKLDIQTVNIRDFAENKHSKCDDYPFGGGAGMVMMPQPIGSCFDSLDPDHKAYHIYLSPKGKVFTQSKAFELLAHEDIIMLCGHYEGVDQRVIDLYIDEEISIGDYVLTGGELPAMVVCDCIARYVDGVLSDGSLVDESISSGLLEYPQYTRPAEYKGLKVPEVLLSGDHAKTDEWRRKESLRLTRAMRPDLLGPANITSKSGPDNGAF